MKYLACYVPYPLLDFLVGRRFLTRGGSDGAPCGISCKVLLRSRSSARFWKAFLLCLESFVMRIVPMLERRNGKLVELISDRYEFTLGGQSPPPLEHVTKVSLTYIYVEDITSSEG